MALCLATVASAPCFLGQMLVTDQKLPSNMQGKPMQRSLSTWDTMSLLSHQLQEFPLVVTQTSRKVVGKELAACRCSSTLRSTMQSRSSGPATPLSVCACAHPWDHLLWRHSSMQMKMCWLWRYQRLIPRRFSPPFGPTPVAVVNLGGTEKAQIRSLMMLATRLKQSAYPVPLDNLTKHCRAQR